MDHAHCGPSGQDQIRTAQTTFYSIYGSPERRLRNWLRGRVFPLTGPCGGDFGREGRLSLRAFRESCRKLEVRVHRFPHRSLADINTMHLPSAASPIEQYLRHLYGKFSRLEDGVVATYIPELGRARPGWFGIAIATVDGQVYEVGDSRIPFTSQFPSRSSMVWPSNPAA